MTDPFGTDALRDGTILAWRNSPTRLREDAAAEADLVRAGYRDRLLTELAQNAADAAARAGVPGRCASNCTATCCGSPTPAPPSTSRVCRLSPHCAHPGSPPG
ncbi:hypothetical protein GS470_00930 [Rhodococcus hoagii]|nr:hypothetical protein [Prescottella equi]